MNHDSLLPTEHLHKVPYCNANLSLLRQCYNLDASGPEAHWSEWLPVTSLGNPWLHDAL
jgi:hypothetical protein